MPPASRQKSCNECVKTKRRCGKELPECARCLKKGIRCVYAGNGQSGPRQTDTDYEFSWIEDLMRETRQWSGELQSQLHPEVAVPEYLVSTEGPRVTTLARAETEAAVHRFKTWPEKWLKEGKAPFIHPQLYSPSMPKPLMDAYAACAVYATKTTQNQAIALEFIEAKATELLASQIQSSWTPLDLLACIQALIIYQFIRLFDGDVRQRALAEGAEPILEAWTRELQARTETERHFTTLTAPSWRSWIFAESARRTIIMSLFLTGIYSLVKQGFCTVADAVTANSFTAQRALWEAPNELAWVRARAAYEPLWIDKMDFGHVLQAADGADLDDFGMMLMITYTGQDIIDHWIATKDLVGIPNFQQSLSDIVNFGDVSVPASDTT